MIRFPFEPGPYGTPTLRYDTFRATSPVCRVSVPSGLEVWLVTRYEDILRVHTDPLFSRDEAVRLRAALVRDAAVELDEKILQNLDGIQHSRIRGIFAEYYQKDHSARWAEVINGEADAAIGRVRQHEVFDLRLDFFEPVARGSAEQLFGFPPNPRSDLLELFFKKNMQLELNNVVSSLLDSEKSLHKSLLADILSKGEQLTRSEIISNISVLMTVTFAAVEAPFLGGIFALLRHPNQWEACVNDRVLLPNAVDEMLRCFPNGDGQFLRIAVDDTSLSDKKISKGEAVLAPVAAANMDPSVFPDPRRYDVYRSNSKKHLAFGAGPHRCLGASLVKVWMQTALAALVDRLPSLRLAVDASSVPYRNTSLRNVLGQLPVAIG
jgi:cytochrome P450